ncbi:succinate dehydrogenase, cytochrome b556 subunit [Glaciecola sp. KUL10]|uniref:succinate dehydrogenase, cytochrome b556 subunit n=1 Tax=Glaciecola sp. (strain KUL10) TaxID=2161813 RepID=UPI000D78AC3D|nr:succinate dehydrogenase, cytochrome b556 subunit [Glaciecola sp. KUL10]GBL03248.1 succinate dehydrogenase, cytochrome b subunit [Glaciecola sp. KUL10]
MKKQRPVNLDLTTIKLPPAGRASILHRVTGVAMFFALLFVIYAWAISISSEEGFNSVIQAMDAWYGKIILIGTVSALLYHIIGGIRHVIMDMGYWEELESGTLSANIAIGSWIVISIALGVILW